MKDTVVLLVEGIIDVMSAGHVFCLALPGLSIQIATLAHTGSRPPRIP